MLFAQTFPVSRLGGKAVVQPPAQHRPQGAPDQAGMAWLKWWPVWIWTELLITFGYKWQIDSGAKLITIICTSVFGLCFILHYNWSGFVGIGWPEDRRTNQRALPLALGPCLLQPVDLVATTKCSQRAWALQRWCSLLKTVMCVTCSVLESSSVPVDVKALTNHDHVHTRTAQLDSCTT